MALAYIEDNVVALVAIPTVFVVAPLAVAYARLLWKRSNEPRLPNLSESADIARRLEQLQHAVDAMSLEVERISEGQRFVTKALADRVPKAEIRSS